MRLLFNTYHLSYCFAVWEFSVASQKTVTFEKQLSNVKSVDALKLISEIKFLYLHCQLFQMYLLTKLISGVTHFLNKSVLVYFDFIYLLSICDHI